MNNQNNKTGPCGRAFPAATCSHGFRVGDEVKWPSGRQGTVTEISTSHVLVDWGTHTTWQRPSDIEWVDRDWAFGVSSALANGFQSANAENRG